MRVDLTMKDRGLTNKIWRDKHPKWTLLPLPRQPETPPGDFEDHKIYDGQERTYYVVISTVSGWWFGTFLISPNSWDDDPIWLIFFRGVETTNQVCCFVMNGWFQVGDLPMGGSQSGTRKILQEASMIFGAFSKKMLRRSRTSFKCDTLRMRSSSQGAYTTQQRPVKRRRFKWSR